MSFSSLGGKTLQPNLLVFIGSAHTFGPAKQDFESVANLLNNEFRCFVLVLCWSLLVSAGFAVLCWFCAGLCWSLLVSPLCAGFVLNISKHFFFVSAVFCLHRETQDS